VVRRRGTIVRALQPAPDTFKETGAKVSLAETRFVDAHTRRVGGRQIRGERIGDDGREGGNRFLRGRR
jgi:hypothetical protein